MYRVKSGIFGQTANFGQQPCLFHISNTTVSIHCAPEMSEIDCIGRIESF